MDKELRPEVITRKTLVQENVEHISSERFAHFSSWSRLVGAVSWLKCCLSARVSGKGVVNSKSPEALKAAEEFVIRTVQREAFSSEIIALGDGRVVPNDSSIRSLDPYLDEKGLLREGGVTRRLTGVNGRWGSSYELTRVKTHVDVKLMFELDRTRRCSHDRLVKLYC